MAISIYGTSFDAANAAEIAAFWAATLDRPVNPGASEESASLAVREGTADTPLMFHGVPEGKQVKNRVHLDLVTAEFDAELQRLLDLGATVLATFERWTTLSDPEGNEFDLVRG